MKIKLLLVIFIISTLMIFTGCKKTYEYTSVEDNPGIDNNATDTSSNDTELKYEPIHITKTETVEEETPTEDIEEVNRLLEIMDTEVGIDWSIKKLVDLHIDRYDADLEYTWRDKNGNTLKFNTDGTLEIFDRTSREKVVFDYLVFKDGVIAIGKETNIEYRSYIIIGDKLYTKLITKSTSGRHSVYDAIEYNKIS